MFGVEISVWRGTGKGQTAGVLIPVDAPPMKYVPAKAAAIVDGKELERKRSRLMRRYSQILDCAVQMLRRAGNWFIRPVP